MESSALFNVFWLKKPAESDRMILPEEKACIQDDGAKSAYGIRLARCS